MTQTAALELSSTFLWFTPGPYKTLGKSVTETGFVAAKREDTDKESAGEFLSGGNKPNCMPPVQEHVELPEPEASSFLNGLATSSTDSRGQANPSALSSHSDAMLSY